MRLTPTLLAAALSFALYGCSGNVVSGTSSSSSTAGSTGSSGSGSTSSTAGSTGSGSTGSGSTSSGSTGSGSTGSGSTGSTLARPNYPEEPLSGYSVGVGGVIQNYTFSGYLAATAGTQIDTASGGYAAFDMQKVRNLTDANGNPYRYMLLDLAAGWCGPCNAEADEYATDGASAAKVGQWLSKGGLYLTVLVQGYDKSQGTSPNQSDVNHWLGDRTVQSSLAGDVNGLVNGSIEQSAFPTNMVVDLQTMEVLDAWYGDNASKLSTAWEGRLNQ